jgi:hypothetical protein
MGQDPASLQYYLHLAQCPSINGIFGPGAAFSAVESTQARGTSLWARFLLNQPLDGRTVRARFDLPEKGCHRTAAGGMILEPSTKTRAIGQTESPTPSLRPNVAFQGLARLLLPGG